MLPSLRAAFHQLLRRPALSLMAMVILALGLAPLVAGWTAFRRVEAWKVAFSGDRRLAWVEAQKPGTPTASEPGELPLSMVSELQAHPAVEKVVAGVMTWARVRNELGGDYITTSRSRLFLDPQIFPLLGLKMRLGRPLEARDALPEALASAVLTEKAWYRHFDGDPKVVGQVVELQDVAFQVVGVLASTLPHEDWDTVDFILPLDGQGRSTVGSPVDLGDARTLLVRLREGWTRDRATAALGNLSEVSAQRWPALRDHHLVARPLGGRMGLERLVILLGFGLPTFLVAGAAVSSLLLALGSARQGEMALRGVLGAQRRRLLVEGLLPALLLCLPAVVLAWVPSQVVLRFLAPNLSSPEPEVRLFAGLAFLALLGALAAGAWPAWRASAVDPARIMGKGSMATPGDTRRGWARLLTSFQVTVAVALLGVSAMALNHLRKTLDIEPFPHWRETLTIYLPLPEGDPIRGLENTRLRLAAMEGVRVLSLGQVNPLPEDGLGARVFTAEGKEARAIPNMGDPSLLEVMGLRLLGGRPPQVTGEALVSRVLAQRLWGETSPLGQTFQRRISREGAHEKLVVVGLCEDPLDVLRGGRRVAWFLTAPDPQSVPKGVQAMVRLDSGGARALERLGRQLLPMNAGKPTSITTVESLVTLRTRLLRTLSVTLGGLGILVLVLALSGLAGLVHIMVARRTRELGVRSSLGASGARLTWQVVLETLGMGLWGLPLGALGTGLGTFLASRMTYGFQLFHWPSLLLIVGMVTLALAAAALAPALGAARVHPAEALRME